jgi:hypothetical protein
MSESMILPWRPLKWKPVYDLMVTLFIQGHTHKEIADITGYTPVQVGNIIRSPDVKKKIDLLTKQLHERILENSEDQLSVIKAKAIKNVAQIISDETLAVKRPFETARMSIDILKGLGTFQTGNKTEVNVNSNNTQTIAGITGEQLDKLTAALELSNEVAKLHGAKEVKLIED